MSEWIKRSEREPTEADYRVGVRFGWWVRSPGKLAQWLTTGRTDSLPILRNYATHWQSDPAPERPKRREFWANLKTGCFYSLKASGSGDLIRLVEFSPDEPVPPL